MTLSTTHSGRSGAASSPLRVKVVGEAARSARFALVKRGPNSIKRLSRLNLPIQVAPGLREFGV